MIHGADRRALARLLSWIEQGDPRGEETLASRRADHSHFVLGVTGPPGAGKSTLTNALIAQARGNGQTVGVVAIDPTSPYTGGALLGDRIRMMDHIHDGGVFVRSMATRGALGGLAAAVPSALEALASSGFQHLIVETVGVGQVETAIVDQADTTIVVLAPGWGDHVQASKAGILEIADVFVVNKADLPGASDVVTDLEQALSLRANAPWLPPVVLCSAEKSEGVDAVAAAIGAHRAHAQSSGELERRRRDRRISRLRNALQALAVAETNSALAHNDVAALIAAVGNGSVAPIEAARQVLEGLLSGARREA